MHCSRSTVYRPSGCRTMQSITQIVKAVRPLEHALHRAEHGAPSAPGTGDRVDDGVLQRLAAKEIVVVG